MPRVLLGPGASGGTATLAPYVAGLCDRGVTAEAVRLPRGAAERAVPVFAAAAGAELPTTVVGGHSFGGRVASLLAAETSPAGLVLFSYPLHRPGHPEQTRTAHWPRIRCPVLLLSGDADPFARIDLLHDAVPLLPLARLVVFPGMRHGLLPVLDDALDRVVAFLAEVRSG